MLLLKLLRLVIASTTGFIGVDANPIHWQKVRLVHGCRTFCISLQPSTFEQLVPVTLWPNSAVNSLTDCHGCSTIRSGSSGRCWKPSI